MHRATHAATPATQASRVSTTHTYSHLTRVFTPPHHGADDQVAAAPCGGAARPAPDEGAGTQAPRPATSRQVRADLHQRCVAAPPQLVCGRVTAAQCGSGPFGTGAAGGEPLYPPSFKLRASSEAPSLPKTSSRRIRACGRPASSPGNGRGSKILATSLQDTGPWLQHVMDVGPVLLLGGNPPAPKRRRRRRKRRAAPQALRGVSRGAR